MMVAAPSNLSEKDQQAILDAEKRIALMLKEVGTLQDTIANIRKKAEAVRHEPRDERKANKAHGKEPQQETAKTQNAGKKKKKTPTIPQQGDKRKPAPDPLPDEQLWSRVVGRKEKRREKETNPSGGAEKRAIGVPGGPTPPPAAAGKRKRRPPRSAAVVMTCEKELYADKLREAREKVNLEEIGIKDLRIRRAITGGYIFEVYGEEKTGKADRLAAKLREEVDGVKIARPCKTADIRVRNLDASVTTHEVRTALAREGQCGVEEINVGLIKQTQGGLGTVWARCPLASAAVIARTGRVKVGWTSARVELLPERPLQCSKCLEGGHVAVRCPNREDYSRRCYRCGREGHLVHACSYEAHCIACEAKKYPAGHKTGSKSCKTARIKRRGRRLGITPTPSPPTSSRPDAAEITDPSPPSTSGRETSGKKALKTPETASGVHIRDEAGREEPKPQRERPMGRKRTRPVPTLGSDTESESEERPRKGRAVEAPEEDDTVSVVSDATCDMEVEEKMEEAAES